MDGLPAGELVGLLRGWQRGQGGLQSKRGQQKTGRTAGDNEKIKRILFIVLESPGFYHFNKQKIIFLVQILESQEMVPVVGLCCIRDKNVSYHMRRIKTNKYRLLELVGDRQGTVRPLVLFQGVADFAQGGDRLFEPSEREDFEGNGGETGLFPSLSLCVII